MTSHVREATRIRRRLTTVHDRLRRARARTRVLAEQVAHLQGVADDAETRRLVAATPLADREWREARTDLERHERVLDEARREVDELQQERDHLLDRLLELERTTR